MDTGLGSITAPIGSVRTPNASALTALVRRNVELIFLAPRPSGQSAPLYPVTISSAIQLTLDATGRTIAARPPDIGISPVTSLSHTATTPCVL